jgi:ribosomal protein L35
MALFSLALRNGRIVPPFQARSVSAKSHSASKKRFKPRGSGGMVYKPAGRKHGMHKHSRNRNRSKGAAVVINRGENGDLWRRLRSMNIRMRQKKVHKLTKRKFTGERLVFKFSSQITGNKSLMSIVATEVTSEMAPTVIMKKVQWRTVA